MVYNFRIPDNGNKKAEKLFKRIEKISFMVNNGFFILSTSAVLTFVSIKLINLFTPISLLEGHNIILAILSFCIGGFLTSLYNAFLNEKGTYRKLCKALKCSVFVKDLDMKISDTTTEISGICIPDIHVEYDVNNNDGKTALLIRVDENTHKIISYLDTSNTGEMKKLVVSSKDFSDCMQSAATENGLIVLRVCQIKKETNGYVKECDIDDRLIAEEAFFKAYEIV